MAGAATSPRRPRGPGRSLLVGNTTQCTATVSPSSSILTVQAWRFTGDSLGVQIDTTGDVRTWSFAPTVCGTVRVTGLVEGIVQTASARVEVFCNMLASVSQDSILNDPAVQRAMRQYWAASNPNDTVVANRREQGGLIVRDSTGALSVVPFSSNATPTLCTARLNGADFTPIFQNGGTVIASFHTHTHDPGTTPPANCNIRGAQFAGAVFGDGASPADYNAVHNPSFPIPLYVVDRTHVHRIRPGERFSRAASAPHREPLCHLQLGSNYDETLEHLRRVRTGRCHEQLSCGAA